MLRINYPGDQASWRADRSESVTNRWRLVQEARFGADRLSFGLAGRAAPGALLALGRFADGSAPYAARLLLRDPQRSPRPYLQRPGGGKTPLDRRLPPRASLRSYGAEARSPAGADLAGEATGAAWAFRFPAAAIGALSALDPREAVAVEFLFSDDSVRRAYIEVGDFAAGRAFVMLAQR
jgi:hypothetical protein